VAGVNGLQAPRGCGPTTRFPAARRDGYGERFSLPLARQQTAVLAVLRCVTAPAREDISHAGGAGSLAARLFSRASSQLSLLHCGGHGLPGWRILSRLAASRPSLGEEGQKVESLGGGVRTVALALGVESCNGDGASSGCTCRCRATDSHNKSLELTAELQLAR